MENLVLQIPQFTHDINYWKKHGSLYEGYSDDKFKELGKMMNGVIDEDDYSRILTIMVKEKDLYSKYSVMREMLNLNRFSYLNGTKVRKPMNISYLLDKFLSTISMSNLLAKDVYLPIPSDMYVNVPGLFLFVLWYKGNFGVNLLDMVNEYAYCNIHELKANACISSDLRSVLFSLIYFSRAVLTVQEKSVKEFFGDWEHNVKEGEGVGYYANVMSVFNYKFGGIVHTYYSVGIAHIFRMIYISEERVEYMRAYNRVESGFIRYWVYNNPLILIPSHKMRNVICAHSMYDYYDEYLSSMSNTESEKIQNILVEFHSEYILNKDSANIVDLNFDLCDEVYDRLHDCFLDVICEAIGYKPYQVSKDDYKQYLLDTIKLLDTLEGDENYKYNMKRKMYECAPIKQYYRDHLRRSEVGALKNFYGFFYPLIRDISIYDSIKVVYFIGCGESKWYSMLSEVLYDKQIVYIDLNKIVIKPGSDNVSTYIGDMCDVEYTSDSYMYFDVYSKESDGSGLISKVLKLIDYYRPILYCYKYYVDHVKYGYAKILFREIFIMPFTRFGTFELRCWGYRSDINPVNVKSKNLISYFICYQWLRQRGYQCVDCTIIDKFLKLFNIVHPQMKIMLKNAGVSSDIYYKDYGSLLSFGNNCNHSFSEYSVDYCGKNFKVCCYLRLLLNKISPHVRYRYYKMKRKYVELCVEGKQLELHVKTRRKFWNVMVLDPDPDEGWNRFLIGCG